jgi:hypothetical protein
MKGSISLALTVLWLASLTVLAATHEGKPSMDLSSLEQIHVIEEAASTAPENKSSDPAK